LRIDQKDTQKNDTTE